MSDIDDTPMDGMDDMGDNVSDASDGGDYTPPSMLPEGIKKDILQEGEGWKKPKAGDEVTVHYVGSLESDGSEFDSSRARDSPFTFSLGKGQVIKGWDEGVATMKKGELAKFTLVPEYAYGASGSPPKIPANATLVFEVELLSWTSRDDLFGDEGVIKTTLSEGSGWKMPNMGDEVLCCCKVMAADGSVVQDKADFEYQLGSGAFGPVSQAVDKALTTMKKAEDVSLKCDKDYCDGEVHPDGVTIELSFSDIYETKDVSFAKDKSILKKQLKEGEGYDTPKDGVTVTILVSQATDGTDSLPGFAEKTIEMTVGNGDVCDVLEFAVAEMKKFERAVITCNNPAQACGGALGIESAGQAKLIVLTVELTHFEKGTDTYSMKEGEKIEFAGKRKEVATALFKANRIELALLRYKKISDLLNYTDNYTQDNKDKAKEFKRTCELNKAACYLKLKDYASTKKSCNEVLKTDSENIKALYRRAQADFAMRNFEDCIRDCRRIVMNDSQNKDARALLKQAQAGQKEEDKKAKSLFSNMCKALGKGPIPPPGKSKDVDNDDEDDSLGDYPEPEDKENEGPANVGDESPSKLRKTEGENDEASAATGEA